MSEVRMCPQCGSPGVDFATLIGGQAACRGCSWKGITTDLLVVPSSVDGIDERAMSGMINEVRQLLSGPLGLPYLRFLLKWGFLAGDLANPAATIDRKKYARYCAAIARGILTALYEERSKQEAARAAERAGMS